MLFGYDLKGQKRKLELSETGSVFCHEDDVARLIHSEFGYEFEVASRYTDRSLELLFSRGEKRICASVDTYLLQASKPGEYTRSLREAIFATSRNALASLHRIDDMPNSWSPGDDVFIPPGFSAAIAPPRPAVLSPDMIDAVKKYGRITINITDSVIQRSDLGLSGFGGPAEVNIKDSVMIRNKVVGE